MARKMRLKELAYFKEILAEEDNDSNNSLAAFSNAAALQGVYFVLNDSCLLLLRGKVRGGQQ
ncbi:MAG: hypothetical protein HY954_08690 [Deltaproteobacteria bacterium]|nr:hypothetical protein [Deltaproteobacteria bacterium]